MRVGTVGSPPFVFNDTPIPQGISIEVWEEIARTENLDYELIRQPSVKEGIEALVRGEVDLLIGPISITGERLEIVQFSQPYYIAEMGLLLPEDEPTLWTVVKPFFRLAFISSIGILILLLFTMGNLLWLAEKRRNPEQFPKEYLPGISSGMWFALVTLTTVGYGDKAPITKTGKFLTAVWMLITMVTASSLTAGLATAFTIALSQQTTARFKEPRDLFNQKIAVVSGTTGASWAEYYGAKLLETNNLSEAIELLTKKEVDGVVFDTPALRYYLSQNPNLKFRLANFVLATENYGFALPYDSQQVQRLNVEIVKMDKEGEIREIVEKWLK
nr:transporter substrate-binding domain-containing protein [Gloeocapsa sp. PCC 73106]